MSDYQFVLTLEDAEESAPQVRMWIDDQFSHDLSSEHEVTLAREQERAWSGTFDARGAFIYRIGIVARPGSRWSLSFSKASDGEELLFDSDDLTLPKEWLVGTCEGIEVAPLHALRDASATRSLSS
jgi:hypothetical protein